MGGRRLIHAESWSRVVARDVVQPGLVGKVHSAFNRACNLICAGSLIGLVDPALGNGPYTIVVPTPIGGYTSSPAWQPGRTVSFQLGILLLEGHPVVDFASAVEWEPDPARPAQIGDHASAADRLGRALTVLGQEGALHTYVLAAWEGRAYQSGPLLVALPRLRGFRDACLAEPVRAVEKAMTLIGLGPGLTPSGDDFLAGLIATLVRADRWGMASEPVVRLSRMLSDLALTGVLGRTTPFSESMLKAAAQGWLPEAPSNLVTGLLGGVLGAMGYLPRTLALGHSSGADLAGGIYVGLRILADAPKPRPVMR
jgi:hypothetical protein